MVLRLCGCLTILYRICRCQVGLEELSNIFLLTLYKQALHAALQQFFSPRQLLLVGGLLREQPPHVRVGRLDHRVERVGVALVTVTSL